MKTSTTKIRKMIKQLLNEAEQFQIPFGMTQDDIEQYGMPSVDANAPEHDGRTAVQVAQANIDSLLGMNMPDSTPIGFISDEGGYMLSYSLGTLGNYDFKGSSHRLSDRHEYRDEVQMVASDARIDGPTGFMSIITVNN